MATNFNSTLYTNQKSGAVTAGGPGFQDAIKTVVGKVSLTTVATTGDVLNFGYVPRGARIVDAKLISDSVDNSGTAVAFALDIGDSGSTNRIYAASTIGQAGGVDVGVQAGAIGHLYTADTPIFGTVNAGAPTAVAGGVVLLLNYTVDGLATS